MPKIKCDEIDLFIGYFNEKRGCVPSQSTKKAIADEVASFVHDIERKLIDRYELDYEYK